MSTFNLSFYYTIAIITITIATVLLIFTAKSYTHC